MGELSFEIAGDLVCNGGSGSLKPELSLHWHNYISYSIPKNSSMRKRPLI